jgi:6-phosphogluconolactonase
VNGELIVVDDVAATFATMVNDAFVTREAPVFALALSGGDTARRCYAELAARDEMDPIDWSAVELYWGDERCVPLDDEASNYRLAREALLDRVGEPLAVHPMVCEDADGYDALIAAASLDVVHLGLGPDGHTASLFPGSAALEVSDRSVVRNEDPSGTNPLPRLTFTLSAIAATRLVIVTVEGDAKREALARVRAGDDVPAARVRARRVVWLADHAAAGG